MTQKRCSNDESKAAAGGAHRHQLLYSGGRADRTWPPSSIPATRPERILEALEKEGVEVRVSSSLPTATMTTPRRCPPSTGRCPQAEIYIHQADANGAGSHLVPPGRRGGRSEALRRGGYAHAWGTTTIQVLHTPGHSPGSVTLKVEDVLFTGDTLFAGSCGRTDLRGGSYEQIMAVPEAAGGAEGGLPRLSRPRGHLHPGAGAEEQPLPDGGHAELRGRLPEDFSREEGGL